MDAMSAADHLHPEQFEFINHPTSGGSVEAFDPETEEQYAYLDWTNEQGGSRPNSVWVHPSRRHQGIATALFQHAQQHGVEFTMDNDERTDAGEGWARSLGAPPRARKVDWENSMYPEDDEK